MAKDPKDLTAAEVIDGLNKLGARAAVLGLLPDDGAKISQRGEFIVGESNIEADANLKMRGYRPQAFPKTVHAWGVHPETDVEGPLDLVVKNAAELEKALAAGWGLDSVHGPAGRIVAGAVVEAAEAEPEVREIAAPGQIQPHDAKPQTGTKAAKAEPAKVTKPKAAKKK